MKNFESFKITLECNSICDFCGGKEFTLLFDKMRHNLNLETKICNKCFLVQSNPMPTKETISDFYENYYHLFHKRRGVDDDYVAKSRRSALRRVDLLNKFLDTKRKLNLLEIGPGAGEFMLRAPDTLNINAEAIELGKESFEHCLKLGISVINIGIEEFTPSKNYDVIASFHVLEHIISPVNFVKKCHSSMVNGGILYLEVPNFDKPGVAYNLFLQFPHLYNFTSITLTNILRSNGFEPFYIEDSISKLTVISKKVDYVSSDFIHGNLKEYLSIIKRKNMAYELNVRIPDLPIINRFKELLRTY